MKPNQCQECGKFSRYEDMDSYTPFERKNYDFPEPLNDIAVCKECSKELYQRFKARFAQGNYRGSHWRKSTAERKAAQEAGLIWIGNDSNIQYNGRRAYFEYIPQKVWEEAEARAG